MKILAVLAMIITGFALVSDGHWWGGWLAVPVVWLISTITHRETETFWAMCFGICVVGGALMLLGRLLDWLL